MKTLSRFAAVLLVALAGSLAHQAAHAYALFFQTSPNPVNVSVGDTFTVRVMLDDPASLASYDFTLGFDKTLVSLTGATAQTFAANFTSTIDNVVDGIGSFSSFDLSGLAADAAGPITLAEVSFTALADGSTTISVLDPLEVRRQPSLGFNLAADTAKPDISDARSDVNIRTGTVRVPEPASLALLGVAIVAAGVGAARRRAAA